jgi:purine nucleosidase
MPIPVIMDVDTGTDDAGALLLAATSTNFQLVAATATFGNCSRDQAARNTLVVLEAAGRTDVPVFPGLDQASGPAPTSAGADIVMGSDGLGDAGIAGPASRPQAEPAVTALSRMAAARPGELTVIAVAPLTTLAAALAADPGLPGRLHHLIVMGGAISVSGNVSAAAEANIGHDPEAAAKVVDVFGAPGALASGRPPQLVPLDVTLRSPLTEAELAALAASQLPGADLLHTVWSKIWPTGLLETGTEGVWPAHDLLTTFCVANPSLCTWMTAPLAVDTGRSAAWGATVADRRVERLQQWGLEERTSPNRWDIAIDVNASRYRASVRAWLAGQSI